MEIPAIVERVSFRKENGFALLACNLNPNSDKYTQELEDLMDPCINHQYNTFTVSMGMLSPNEDPTGAPYIFIGDIVTHKKFGKQFQAEFYHQDLPKDSESLRAFLMTLPNIKKQRSKQIIDLFGVEGTLDVLDNNIDKLIQINGITQDRIPPIKKAWDEKKYMRDLYNWLIKHKIELRLAEGIYKKWGNGAIEKIEEDPYVMVELWGVGFIKADAYAHRIKKNISKASRTKACIQYILQEAFNKDSDLCVKYKDLKVKVCGTIGECDANMGQNTNLEEYVGLVREIIKNNRLDFAVINNNISKEIFVYLREVWEKELFVSKALYESYTNGVNGPLIDMSVMPQMIEEVEKDISERESRQIILDHKQKEAITSVFQNNITVITGGGGTGKSTICRGIFYIAQKIGKSIKMMSPTGKASQVLTGKTGCMATTIHRALKMVPGEDLPKESIDSDILLVDEISMAGLDTMYAIMAALEGRKDVHIVVVGDKNQLPSVSAGNFLSDMMESKIANIVELDVIHRQDEGSYISVLADHMSKGKYMPIPEDANDVKWININSADFDGQLINFIEEYLKIRDMSNLQIISPMKKGNCGVFKINETLQKYMAKINNTELLYIERGFSRFYVGDRVIQVENNYEKDVFNGDMGVITDIGQEVRNPKVSDEVQKYVEVEYYGNFIRYYDDEIEQIMLAWAITVHKFQGSQSLDIMFVIANEAQIMMSKELVYTALTRAEKMLYMCGNISMLHTAATKSIVRKRNTNMCAIIEGLRTNNKVIVVLGE